MATVFNEDDTVTIEKKRYERLLKSAKELSILEAYGVDNWNGYGEAMAELYPDEDDEEEDND